MRPQRENRLAFKTIGEETIILDSKIGKEVHQLNAVASFVWNLCDGNHDIESITAKVCDEFEVEADLAKKDIHDLLSDFKEKSLITDIA